MNEFGQLTIVLMVKNWYQEVKIKLLEYGVKSLKILTKVLEALNDFFYNIFSIYKSKYIKSFIMKF